MKRYGMIAIAVLFLVWLLPIGVWTILAGEPDTGGAGRGFSAKESTVGGDQTAFAVRSESPAKAVSSPEERSEEERDRWLKALLEKLDLQKLDAVSPEELPERMTFLRLVEELMADGAPDTGKLISWVYDLLFYEFAREKGYFLQLLALTAAFGIFRQLMELRAGFAASVSGMMVGLTMTVILMKSFLVIAEVARGTIGGLFAYMKLLVPVYAMTLTLSGNPASAAMYYELSFLIMALLTGAMRYLLVPGIHVYLLLRLFDQLFEEERLTRLAELIASIIRNVTKYGMAAVLGISCIQGMLGRAKDQLDADVVLQSMAALPGVGDILGSSGNILVSCAVLVKNSVGIAAVVFLLAICLPPLLKVVFFVFLFRLLAAILQPVADRRLVAGIHSTAQAGKLYFLLLRDSAVMFVLTVAVIAAAGT